MFIKKFYKLLKQAVEAQAPAFMKSFINFLSKVKQASKRIMKSFYKLLKQARSYEKF